MSREEESNITGSSQRASTGSVKKAKIPDLAKIGITHLQQSGKRREKADIEKKAPATRIHAGQESRLKFEIQVLVGEKRRPLLRMSQLAQSISWSTGMVQREGRRQITRRMRTMWISLHLEETA